MWCICIGVFNLSVPQTHWMLKCEWHHFSSVFTCLPNIKVSALFKSIFRLVEWHSESYVRIFLNTGKPRKKATLLLAQSSFLLRHGPDTIRWKVVLLLWQPKPRTVTSSLHCTRMCRICIYFLKYFRRSSLVSSANHRMLRCKWHHLSSIFPLLHACKLHLPSKHQGFNIV